jgi:hypothetical protein
LGPVTRIEAIAAQDATPGDAVSRARADADPDTQRSTPATRTRERPLPAAGMLSDESFRRQRLRELLGVALRSSTPTRPTEGELFTTPPARPVQATSEHASTPPLNQPTNSPTTSASPDADSPGAERP